MSDEPKQDQDAGDQYEDGGDQRRNNMVKAGVAVGIGSAAIVAALLYASKAKKPGDKKS
jgi:hypothetical protein